MPIMHLVGLLGDRVRLEPLSFDHGAGLIEAVQDGELWKLWYTSIPAPGKMHVEIGRRLALQDAGSMIPYATRDWPSPQIVDR